MADHPEMRSNVSEAQEAQFAVVDEKILPELIQGQIGKLNELDSAVKKALYDAGEAEKRAHEAHKLSASPWSFKDQKKEAIEGLQKAGIELAGAVQSGSQAQKLSFEFQARLAEVTKYLFSLGVSNIAANRTVVRELEIRLRGASEEELSELARKELMTVIQQLKEQEDLLRKQQQMREVLSRHDFKINHLLTQTDDLALGVKNQNDLHQTLAKMIDSMEQVSKQQQQEISILQQQVSMQQAGLERLTAALTTAGTHAEQATASLRALNLRIALLAIWAIAVPAVVYFLR
jgi:DNA-binding ferritin-like protein (Dps family)